jgi:hypothetical protein
MLYEHRFTRFFSFPTILLTLMTGCSSSSTSSPNVPTPKPTVSLDKYQISEITYKWGAGFVERDRYDVTLRKDGTAEYFGDVGASKKGKYRGRIDTAQFDQLASLIIQKDFFSLKDKYAADGTDADTVIISVLYAGGLKTVVNYGGGGDDEVGDVQRAIAQLASQITWQEY